MSTEKPPDIAVTAMDTDLISDAVFRTGSAMHEASWKRILKLLAALTEEERHIGRPLRGHTKIGCHCRYCRSVLSNRIVLNGEEL